MYKLITISTLLLGLALAPVLGGSVGQEPRRSESLHEDPRDQDRDGNLDSRRATGDAVVADSSSCEWRCEACEPGQGCSQTCTEIGNCGSTCNVVARCDAGYAWDESSCGCVN